MNQSSFAVLSASRTHPGRVRTRNEDAVLDRGDIGLWAVADGMGGHSRGDWASAQVVRRLSDVPAPETPQSLLRHVRAAIHQAHEDIRAAAAADGCEGVIGCTVVALMASGPFFACLWAGDSRLYRLRDGHLAQLSRDHSQVQELIDARLLSPEAAQAHPMANVITRAVGVAELELELIMDRIEPGDVILLCTDGLDKMISDDDIAECLSGRPPSEGADTLIDRALERGGRDNVSVVVVAWSAAADEGGGGGGGGGDDDDTVRIRRPSEPRPISDGDAP